MGRITLVYRRFGKCEKIGSIVKIGEREYLAFDQAGNQLCRMNRPWTYRDHYTSFSGAEKRVQKEGVLYVRA